MKQMMNYIMILTMVVSAAFCMMPPKKDRNRFEKSVICLEKTECYGTCPVYNIVIYGTGKVKYEGKRFVKKEGKYQKQLGKSEINKLFNAYECANFFDFKSEYTDSLLMDLPTTYVTFEHRGFKRKVKDYVGAPEELKKLEKMVIDIAESEEGWVKE